MAEPLFAYLHKERDRLEAAILDREARGKASTAEIRRLRLLHRIVNEQIARWMRDLHEGDPHRLRSAA